MGAGLNWEALATGPTELVQYHLGDERRHNGLVLGHNGIAQ